MFLRSSPEPVHFRPGNSSFSQNKQPWGTTRQTPPSTPLVNFAADDSKLNDLRPLTSRKETVLLPGSLGANQRARNPTCRSDRTAQASQRSPCNACARGVASVGCSFPRAPDPRMLLPSEVACNAMRRRKSLLCLANQCGPAQWASRAQPHNRALYPLHCKLNSVHGQRVNSGKSRCSKLYVRCLCRLRCRRCRGRRRAPERLLTPQPSSAKKSVCSPSWK